MAAWLALFGGKKEEEPKKESEPIPVFNNTNNYGGFFFQGGAGYGMNCAPGVDSSGNSFSPIGKPNQEQGTQMANVTIEAKPKEELEKYFDDVIIPMEEIQEREI